MQTNTTSALEICYLVLEFVIPEKSVNALRLAWPSRLFCPFLTPSFVHVTEQLPIALHGPHTIDSAPFKIYERCRMPSDLDRRSVVSHINIAAGVFLYLNQLCLFNFVSTYS
jgi:hypothetical protein